MKIVFLRKVVILQNSSTALSENVLSFRPGAAYLEIKIALLNAHLLYGKSKDHHMLKTIKPEEVHQITTHLNSYKDFQSDRECMDTTICD